MFRSLRETYSEIITAFNDISTELSFSEPQFRKTFVRRNYIPFIELMSGKKGQLRILRKFSKQLKRDNLLWRKGDLDPFRPIAIKNSGILNLKFVIVFFKLREFYKSS
ncbi:hypothetical protein HBN50_12800 [Halobacteriovorax sp. GB3]|uniref:hypothetical protein n=1 Tax=Halobacteriovorax sp. GB3 TaxID=2719615 RepID=UPI00235F6C23|nr:hypothetical protein [Halobacteriovorax sp. GB3]MDD0853983.1 hypothetical protein [Halobacteriovorax sp. GB3]